MKFQAIVILAAAILLASCGKKEQTQTTPQQQDTQQLKTQQTPSQQSSNTPTQKDSTTATKKDSTTATKKDAQKTDDKKTDDKKTDTVKKQDTKKDDTGKKDNDDGTVKNDNSKQVSDIDFAPIFSKKCAKCHGKNGHGKPDGAPDLTSDDVKNKSDKKLFSTISNGVKAKNPDDDDMPAWKSKLSEDEINAAIKYIRNLP